MVRNPNIKIKKQNIVYADETIIGHQVNTQGKMAAGVALQLRRKFPNIYDRYIEFLNESELSVEDMRYCIFVSVDEQHPDDKIVAHLFGQETIGRTGVHTNLKMLGAALGKLSFYAEKHNMSVALPYGMGAGLGGADWNDVYELISYAFDNHPVTLYKYEP